MPPTTLAMRMPRQCLTSSMASCATCCASSRVGHRIRAPGTAALKLRGFVGSLRLLRLGDRKSTRLNSSHLVISYAVFCLKKKHGLCPALAWQTGPARQVLAPDELAEVLSEAGMVLPGLALTFIRRGLLLPSDPRPSASWQ